MGFLGHHVDALLMGRGRVVDGRGVAVQFDGARIRAVDAGEDLHGGGLAGAVAAQQSVDLARSQVQVDAPEDRRAVEDLPDALQGDQSRPRTLPGDGLGGMDALVERQHGLGRLLVGDEDVDVLPLQRGADGLRLAFAAGNADNRVNPGEGVQVDAHDPTVDIDVQPLAVLVVVLGTDVADGPGGADGER